jgi:hypothetical protein
MSGRMDTPDASELEQLVREMVEAVMPDERLALMKRLYELLCRMNGRDPDSEKPRGRGFSDEFLRDLEGRS